MFSVFEDKPFVKEDHAFAVNLFQNVPPFLLSQILGLTMDQWKAIEAVDVKNEHKQLSNVIQEWGKSYDTAKWSVLVETLVELGLRGKAQMASVEKGLLLIYNILLLYIRFITVNQPTRSKVDNVIPPHNNTTCTGVQGYGV